MCVRSTHLVQFGMRVAARTAFRGVSILAALSAVSLTVLYANPFSITIRSASGVIFVANNQGEVPLKSSAFTAPADPQAQWVAVDSNRTPPLTLDGSAVEIDLSSRVLGDLNGDGSVDDADLVTVPFNFGAGG